MVEGRKNYLMFSNMTPGESKVSSTQEDLPEASTVAVVWITGNVAAWQETLRSLLSVTGISLVFVAIADSASLGVVKIEDPRLHRVASQSFSTVAQRAFETCAASVLFVTAPCIFPSELLDLSAEWMSKDPRVGAVSFLSNAAGSLSFPFRNTQTPFGVEEHNEVTLTRRLRILRNKTEGLAPIVVAEGPAVLINKNAWHVCGNLEDYGTGDGGFAVAEFSVRSARRGFNSFLDSFTYVTRSWDQSGRVLDMLQDPDYRHKLHTLHSSLIPRYDDERNSTNSVLAQTLDSVRARAMGLRVLIDGSVLGPKEMGTQQLILQLTLALSTHPGIQSITVGVPDPVNLPTYADVLRRTPRVRLIAAGNLTFNDAGHVDIIHRPFQPSSPIPWDRWRSLSKRSIITIQDVIAYRNGAYFHSGHDWNGYRCNFKAQVANADSIFCISNDVVTAFKEERLPVNDQNLFVVENGTDARSKDQPQAIPQDVLDRGWGARSFVFVIGATYAHKNRDLALKVWTKLRQRGLDHAIILAGANVPLGSSRNDEASSAPSALWKDVLVLPEVGFEQRNWMLRNASLILYLTAAEGFGLVPFEAACMDTPTLHVAFGPLREIIDDDDVPKSYDVEELASRAYALLGDPALANAAISKVLKSTEHYTWKRNADKTVEAYFATLSLPARLGH